MKMYKSASQKVILDYDEKFKNLIGNNSNKDFDIAIDLKNLERIIRFYKESEIPWNLKSIYEFDFSSVSPIFQPKTSSSLIEYLKGAKKNEQDEFYEIEYDYLIRLPPKKKLKLDIEVVNKKKADPKIYIDDFKYIKKDNDEG